MKKTKTRTLMTQQVNPGSVLIYQEERSGRCRKCKIRFIWPRRFGKTRDMLCPYCHQPLGCTSHLWKGRTERLYG